MRSLVVMVMMVMMMIHALGISLRNKMQNAFLYYEDMKPQLVLVNCWRNLDLLAFQKSLLQGPWIHLITKAACLSLCNTFMFPPVHLIFQLLTIHLFFLLLSIHLFFLLLSIHPSIHPCINSYLLYYITILQLLCIQFYPDIIITIVIIIHDVEIKHLCVFSHLEKPIS